MTTPQLELLQKLNKGPIIPKHHQWVPIRGLRRMGYAVNDFPRYRITKAGLDYLKTLRATPHPEPSKENQ